MSKTSPLEQKLGTEYKRADLADIVRSIARQVDGVTEGSIAAFHNAASAAPTGSAVAYAQGDFIYNLAPSVLGSGGSQYIIHGFRCVSSGSPGTWVEVRTLTGT
jgi:hypothetical protein